MTEILDIHTFSLFLLTFVRVASFFLAFPFISTTLIPLNIRILLILAFSFYLSQIIEPSQMIDITKIDLLSFFLLVIRELLLGISFSLLTIIYSSIFIHSAELISYSMGLTIVNIFDSTFGSISVLSRFFVYIFYVVFFFTDAYKIFIAAFAESFKIIPIGNFHLSDSLLYFFLKESKLIFFLSFKIAFPFIITLFITNLILALVNRLIPQINVFIVGLPLQIFIGLFFLSTGFSILIYSSKYLIEKLSTDIINLIKILGH
ncbi:flagellar biosynthetic protein FliR [Desulfurobacterium thermolithotrophum]|uniref:flagellar biosynthetic protein FliR n=1 Tax=Desulfurobacterium thermolithotrophum TaxID=64160 RepID=UPI0013D3E8AD|nr:flagellar biosynthetic protein FliR [Desulfurobacterium thermolithotrophum]